MCRGGVGDVGDVWGLIFRYVILELLYNNYYPVI